MSAFREPVAVVLPPSYNEGVPVGEILPGNPVAQAFRRPVPTLEDVGILFATYARDNHSGFTITLIRGNLPVMRQAFSSSDIEDNRWLRLILTEPIESCTGQDLVLRIESPDASPGNAITNWTYPRYYEGELLQPTDPSLTGRVIGLELNTHSIGHLTR